MRRGLNGFLLELDWLVLLGSQRRTVIGRDERAEAELDQGWISYMQV